MNDAVGVSEEMLNGILHTCVMLAYEVELKQIPFATIPICLTSSVQNYFMLAQGSNFHPKL